MLKAMVIDECACSKKAFPSLEAQNILPSYCQSELSSKAVEISSRKGTEDETSSENSDSDTSKQPDELNAESNNKGITEEEYNFPSENQRPKRRSRVTNLSKFIKDLS